MAISVLSVEDVLQIYGIIVDDFAESDDPIAPAGVRDIGLLESAVYRQSTGFGGVLKYDHALLCAASLAFGICCDHPFYNGNKRAALVAMLVHLDNNQYALPGVSQDELYGAMLAIADHRLGVREDPRRRDDLVVRRQADEEVDAIYQWLRRRAARLEHGERILVYRQLRRILQRFSLELENCGQNKAEIVRYEVERRGLLIKKDRIVRVRVGVIGYHDEGSEIPRSEIKKIRQLCNLTEDDGVDSKAFYTTGEVVQSFVNRYRKVLRRLARR